MHYSFIDEKYIRIIFWRFIFWDDSSYNHEYMTTMTLCDDLLIYIMDIFVPITSYYISCTFTKFVPCAPLNFTEFVGYLQFCIRKAFGTWPFSKPSHLLVFSWTSHTMRTFNTNGKYLATESNCRCPNDLESLTTINLQHDTREQSMWLSCYNIGGIYNFIGTVYKPTSSLYLAILCC